MALTLKLTVGTPCSGGNHFAVTGTPVPGQARTADFNRQEILEPVSAEDIEVFMRVLIRLYRRQLPEGATSGQVKTAIEAKTLDLTVA